MLTDLEKNVIINSAKEDYEDYGACHNGDDIPDIMGDILNTKSKAKKKEAADFFKELSDLGAEDFYNRYKGLDWSDEFKKDFGKSKINKPNVGMSVPRILNSIGQSEENNFLTDKRIESEMYGTDMSPQEAIAKLNYNANYNYKPTGDLVRSPDGIWISKYEYNRKYLRESMEHDMLTEEEKDYIIETAQMDYECGGCTYSDDFYDIMSEILDTDDEEKIAAGIEFYQELAELGPAGMLQEYPELDWSDDYKAEYGEFDDDDVEEECYDHVEDGRADINNTADWYKISRIEGLIYDSQYKLTVEEAKAELGIDPSFVYVPTGNLSHPSFQESSKKNFKEEKTSFVKTLRDIFYEPEWNFTVLGVEPVYNGYKRAENKAAIVLTEDGSDYSYKTIIDIENTLDKEIGIDKYETNITSYADFNEDAPSSMRDTKVVVVELF